jgi:hypothetical protein
VIDAGEVWNLAVRLDNLGLASATGINATLSTSTPGVTVLPSATRTYPDIAAAVGTGTAIVPHQFRLATDFPCGLAIDFTLTVTYTGGTAPQQVFNFSIYTATPTNVSTTLDITAPPAGLGYTAATGIQTGRLNRFPPPSACGVAEAPPGLFATTGSRQFDSYVFTASASGCVTVSISTNTFDLFVAAYNNGGFVPGNPSTNWVADSGSSGPGSFSFNAVGGQQYTIVVSEVNVGAGIGDNYTINVQGPRQGVCFGPSAGEVSIEGRVLNQMRRGLANTTVSLTSPDGRRWSAVTNSFGFYKITDVPVGDAYVIVPISRRFRFTPQVLNVTESMQNVDFIAGSP